jgi:hypothetical protein
LDSWRLANLDPIKHKQIKKLSILDYLTLTELTVAEQAKNESKVSKRGSK